MKDDILYKKTETKMKRYVLVSNLHKTKIIDTEAENFGIRRPKYYIVDGFLYSREVNVHGELSTELYQLGKVIKAFDKI